MGMPLSRRTFKADIRRRKPTLQQPTEQVFQVIRLVSAPLAVSVLAAFFLSLPEQTREIYRGYALYVTANKSTIEPIGQLEIGALGLMGASVLIWVMTRNLTLMFADNALDEWSARGVSLRWLPRFCGAIIPIGAGIGLILAGRDLKIIPTDTGMALGSAVTQKEAAANLHAIGLGLIAFSILLVVIAFLRTLNNRSVKYKRSRRWLFKWPLTAVFTALMLGGIYIFSGYAPSALSLRTAQTLGTPAIFFLFIAVLGFFSCLSSAIYEHYGVPVISLLAVWMVGLALFERNDNHSVGIITETRAAPPKAKDALKAWYNGRADREAYERQKQPYPVYLVSAAGGALYAAEFAAGALARLQDACPGFAQHTFALSAVSGGALGAAVFSGLVQNVPQIRPEQMNGLDPCHPKGWIPPVRSFEDRAKRFLDGDFMSPIAAAGLFPDFAQRFLPFPVERFDRGRMFETSLEAAWSRADTDCPSGGCNPFVKGFLNHWRPDGTSPALVLHATDVDAGYRVAVSPFTISDLPDEYLALKDFHDTFLRVAGARSKDQPAGPSLVHDVKLSTAVGVSTRFPWIMPPASVQMVDPVRKSRLLDGGIFENSGVETITDIVNELAEFEVPPESRSESARNDPWVRFHIVIVTSYQLNQPTILPPAQKKNGVKTAGEGEADELQHAISTFAGEALSPIWAMLAARVQRANVASFRLFRQRGYDCATAAQSFGCSSAGRGGIRFLVLNHNDFRLPLGWQLSSFTRTVVDAHMDNPRQCAPIDSVRHLFTGRLEPSQRQEYTRRENTCTLCSVLTQLGGERFMGSKLCRS